MTEKTYSDQLKEIFDTKFELGFEPPVVFIDTHYNKSNPEELAAFERETEKLWKTSVNRKPFECLTRWATAVFVPFVQLKLFLYKL